MSILCLHSNYKWHSFRGAGPNVSADCDDGLFCNGTETCVSNICASGLPVSCDDGIACTVDSCSEASRICLHTGPDRDGDGHVDKSCGGDDCDDSDRFRYPGNIEVCDASHNDEDCDPTTVGDRDVDADGYVDADCCNPDPAPGGGYFCGDDCDDTRAGVHPNVPEVCNSMDDDCNGIVDEGLVIPLYYDLDADGFGAPNGKGPIYGCLGLPGFAGFSPYGNDCNDSNPAVHPGSMECITDANLGVGVLVCSTLGNYNFFPCPVSTSCVVQPNLTGVCVPSAP